MCQNPPLHTTEDDILNEEEAFLVLELAACSESQPTVHRNYERLDLDKLDETSV